MPKWTSEQQEAIEKGNTNIIVSAGAGSGKTAVLTQRVIYKLKQGVHLDQLLILTFTNAAAREMKERIRSKIINDPSLHQELANVDIAYITTFDAYALSIVKKYHYLLNIDKNVKITDNSIIALRKKEILNEIIEEFYKDVSDDFRNLINDFCNKDDNSLINYLLKVINIFEKSANYQKDLENYKNKFLEEASYIKIEEQYLNLLLLKQTELKSKLTEFKSLVDSTVYENLYQALKMLLNAHNIDEFILSVQGIKLPKIINAPDEVKALKEEINNIKKELQSLCSYGTSQEIKDNIKNTQKYIDVITKIITKFRQKFQQIKLTENLFDFQDIALMATKIVYENPVIQQELKDKYQEIMIDEYQDTNDIQDNFISLISKNNVYVVGDIKQSIYRFRNANPMLFKTKYDCYKSGDNGLKIDLLKNFRSRKEVVDDINLIFNQIMNYFLGGADYINDHQMQFGNEAYTKAGKTNQNNHLTIKMYDYDQPEFTKEEIEAFSIAHDIKEKIANNYQVFDNANNHLRDVAYSDFVILMDRSKDFQLYKKIFEFLNIPLTLYQDESFKDSEDLKIIKNCFVLINKIIEKNFDQEFRYALMSIARSYLFEIKDAQIFEWFKNKDFSHNEVYRVFENISLEINSLTIYELMLKIFKDTDIYTKTILVGDINSRAVRLKKLLDVAVNLDELGYDYQKAKDYLIDVIETDVEMRYSVDEVASNSVKIMTIHKSKGLEFPICYYSGLYKQFNIQELNEKFIFDNNYGFILPYYRDGLRPTILKELLKQQYLIDEISEKIRLFYVALTRAKEKIILILPQNKKEFSYAKLQDFIKLKYRSFADIIYSIKKSLTKYIENINIEEFNLTKEYKNQNIAEFCLNNNSDKLDVIPINEPFVIQENQHFSKQIKTLNSKKEQKNITLGLEFHKTLEMIDLQNFDESLIENEFIKNKINNFLKQSLLKNINNANVFQEYEFIYKLDNIEYHGIIDLILEYNDHIDIIDYKLQNIIDAGYLKQLQGYKKYIASLTNKKINLYLYSIIDDKFEEIG